MLTLTLKDVPPVPLEAEVVCPDRLTAVPLAEVRAAPVWLGNRQLRLDDVFHIEDDGRGGDELEVRGDCSRVKGLGRGMSRGRLRIVGPAGMHLGASMTGGHIEVIGDVGDWAGAEMAGGLIHIRGNAGHLLGSAYRGSPTGLTGGTILVDGTAGDELGSRMRRGLIVVRGPVGDCAGYQMTGGTLLLVAGGGLRTGAGMTRGTVITLRPLSLLPTFTPACDYDPVFVNLYARHLDRWGIDLPYGPQRGCYRRYVGDAAVDGKGELLVWLSPGEPGQP